jgi:hypothetical protein
MSRVKTQIGSNGHSGHNGNGEARSPERALIDVLVPGQHSTPMTRTSPTRRIEVSESDFASSVLAALPKDLLYRSGRAVGTILGDAGARYFEPMKSTHLRIRGSSSIRLVRSSTNKKRVLVTTTQRFTEDHARLVLASAEHASVREIAAIVHCPACRQDFGIRLPGWAEDRVYYDEPPGLAGVAPELDADKIKETLGELVADFPFDDQGDDGASRHNFLGLLLTPMVRPAIVGNVPMHLVLSALERTGKSKLLEEVLGGVILGRPTPALTLSDDGAEFKKEIVSMLVEGDTLIHLDNLGAYIDSPILASLLTSTYVKGRLLGTNKAPQMLNTLIITASGNNVRATGEVVKRIVPIRLQPTDGHPEDRTDFKHPQLRRYVSEKRREVIAALLGMVAEWRRRGMPAGGTPFGGFEDWARVVGGIMQTNGFDKWLTNVATWRRAADPNAADLQALVEEWAKRHGRAPLWPREITDIAEAQGLFSSSLARDSPAAALASFSKRILVPAVGRPVEVIGKGEKPQHVTIRSHDHRDGRRYLLEGPDDALGKLEPRVTQMTLEE